MITRDLDMIIRDLDMITRDLDMITRDLDMITRDLDMIIVQSVVMTSRALISKIHCRLSANQKRVRELYV